MIQNPAVVHFVYFRHVFSPRGGKVSASRRALFVYDEVIAVGVDLCQESINAFVFCLFVYSECRAPISRCDILQLRLNHLM